MRGEGNEVVLLGYSASESESIRRLLSPLTHRYGLVFRNIQEVAYLPALLGARHSSSFVVSNDWHGGIDVNRVIENCKQQTDKPPIIFVSGNMREEIASRVIECGADDYVFWDRLFQLRWIIQGHLKNRLRARTAPSRTGQVGERLSSLLDISTDAIIAADCRSNIIFFNKGAERIFGHTADEIIGQRFTALVPSFEIDVAERNEKLMALMFIDLDGFKKVNDVFGHAAADRTLRLSAQLAYQSVLPICQASVAAAPANRSMHKETTNRRRIVLQKQSRANQAVITRY